MQHPCVAVTCVKECRRCNIHKLADERISTTEWPHERDRKYATPKMACGCGCFVLKLTRPLRQIFSRGPSPKQGPSLHLPLAAQLSLTMLARELMSEECEIAADDGTDRVLRPDRLGRYSQVLAI